MALQDLNVLLNNRPAVCNFFLQAQCNMQLTTDRSAIYKRTFLQIKRFTIFFAIAHR